MKNYTLNVRSNRPNNVYFGRVENVGLCFINILVRVGLYIQLDVTYNETSSSKTFILFSMLKILFSFFKSADPFISCDMNKGILIISMFVIQFVGYTASQKRLDLFAISAFQSEFECDTSILSFMNFRYNNKCVQFVRGNGRYSVGCTSTIIQHSRNITFYMRSISWLLNRNILNEESLRNVNKKNTTRSCENFLIFVDNINSMKSVVSAATFRSNTTAILFAFSKLYFVFEDKNYKFNQSEISELSQIFYETAHFGYIFESNSITKKMGLRDLLTLEFTDSKPKAKRNTIHPFVDRQNQKKQFRVRLNHCYPYIIIEDLGKRR